LPPPWAIELAVALVAIGEQDGRVLIEDAGHDARAIVRDQLDSPLAAMATTARRLLRELPAVPPFRLTLSALGPLELRRDGAMVASSELRRERVRQLVAYLLTHDRPTRAAIMADLWPDLDETAAGRNLRVTLAYLQNVFEPERGELDPPYFVRSVAGSLHLVVGDALAVDVSEFEQQLDEATRLERQGAPSAALAAYERAAALWRGDYFVDLPADEWLQWERDRLRGRFVAAAVRAGNLLLARGSTARARELAQRAIAADEWREQAYQLLIAAHLQAGDVHGARECLQRCYEMLAELDVPAQQRTEALARQLEPSR
jgi:DNA-binding SARP family transcriptional activator